MLVGILGIYPLKLKSDSLLPKKLCYLRDWKSFRNDRTCFLFHLKSSFRFQNIWIFITTTWSSRENSWIRRIRLTWKIMTSQAGLQYNCNTHVAQYLTKLGNQAMKLGQLIEYDKYFPSKIMWKMSQGDLFQTSSFLGEAPTCMSFFPSVNPSVRPSVRHAPNLKNRTSSNHNYWYTYIK